MKKNRTFKAWVWPPVDQWITIWGGWVFAIFVFLLIQGISFFLRLNGARWMECRGIALAAATIGLSLIFHAKLPLYRQPRFLTFGRRAIPESRQSSYRWGYCCIAFAVVLFLGLLLSTP